MAEQARLQTWMILLPSSLLSSLNEFGQSARLMSIGRITI